MGMKKEDMERHNSVYHAQMDQAREASKQGLHKEAIRLAKESWDHIDGMMQFERKYKEKEFVSIEAIDVVLKYAPLILDFRSLEELDSLLKDYRRIDKNTSKSLTDELARARVLMSDAHRMWDHLEQHPEARQDQLQRVLGGDQDQWRKIAETWEKMGLLRRAPEGESYRLTLSTRMGQLVPAKCPACGAVTEAPKAMFLESMTCPTCRADVSFVLLPVEASASQKG